jgi:hypothetical protein
MSKIVEIAGQKFNRLTALHKTGNKNYKNSLLWLFQCECGNTIEREAYAITSGQTKSCGCYARDVAGKQSLKHGYANTKDYSVWNLIKRRILDPTCKLYPEYGGRGLTIDQEFVESMDAFYEHLGPKPADGKRYSVGRIDNDVGYVKGNIRWETYHKQAHNKGKKVTNSSGFTGVVWSTTKSGKTLYAVARWQEGIEQRQCTKCFSVTRFGLLPAFAMACAYREKMIQKLNEQGEEYSAKHGK